MLQFRVSCGRPISLRWLVFIFLLLIISYYLFQQIIYIFKGFYYFTLAVRREYPLQFQAGPKEICALFSAIPRIWGLKQFLGSLCENS